MLDTDQSTLICINMQGFQMPLSAVLLPLFAQVFLTFALLLFRGAPS